MNAKPDDGRRDETRRAETIARGAARSSSGDGATARTGARKRIATRSVPYMIAPARPDLNEAALIERLEAIGGIEVVRIVPARGTASPPVAVVRMNPDKAAELRQSTGGTLVVETDEPFNAASVAIAPAAGAMASAAACAVIPSLGAGFTTTIQVLSETDQPIEQANVQLVGRHWTAQGITGDDGRVELTLHGELPETVAELVVRPRAGHWGLWQKRPNVQADAVNTISLRALQDVKELGWGGQAARFDHLPPDYRGAGVKIALVDSGVATSHPQLAKIKRGFDSTRGDERPWSKDTLGHGTLGAGIIAAERTAAGGIRGFAPDAELHVCKLAPDAACSDLVAALDECLAAGIDVVCLGYGCERGSAILEQRIMAAKERGMAIIAAAGSTGGPVQFPACSLHVLAVGAVGQAGTSPEDSPHAACAVAAGGGTVFVPPFSCRGPELDLCAPGLAVISCQSPDGYVAADGTSLAAPHVAAAAALVLAHHADFRRDFASRDARRVGRLFQILKATAQPFDHPALTGAGLLDTARALGLAAPRLSPLNAGLDDLRNAMRQAGLAGRAPGLVPGYGGFDSYASPEPPRGPALITQVPLTPGFAPAMGAAGSLDAEAGMRDLKAAMLLAGLSPGA